MNFRGETFSANGRRTSRRRAGGYTLIEVGHVLLIFVLAAGLLFDLQGQSRQRRRCERFAADLREFAAAFESHALQPGAVLFTDTGDAAMPAGLEDLLKDTNWRKGSRFGGDCGWVAPEPAHSLTNYPAA